MNKYVSLWKIEYLTDGMYCVKRNVFYPDTGVTVSEHVRRDNGCIDVFSGDDAVIVADALNKDVES